MSIGQQTYTQTTLDKLVACHACDALYQRDSLAPGSTARCSRCHSPLYHAAKHATHVALALTIASLLCYLVAVSLPFLTLEVKGRVLGATLPAAVIQLYRENMWGLASFVSLLILGAPLIRMLGQLYILIPLELGRLPPSPHFAARLLRWLTPWNMTEVYLISVLVVLVKVAKMADVVLGLAFWAFIAQVVLLTASQINLDRNDIWRRLKAGESRSG